LAKLLDDLDALIWRQLTPKLAVRSPLLLERTALANPSLHDLILMALLQGGIHLTERTRPE
jgi:hypothetical protein